MNEIKLVIWDLDCTFWKGTLLENTMEVIPSNIEIVKKLTDRGIMNSIVSKNDFDMVKEVLSSLKIWDYFIFPKISYEPKGTVIMQLLKQCNLRAANVLFIDDNILNLEEVKYYNKNINTSTPNILNVILDMPEFVGKDDKEHSRLLQYKLLEKRDVEKGNYSSNIEFLKNSSIEIDIRNDCIGQEKRIFELIQRTNQLNYTKRRDSIEELHKLIIDKNIESRYILARDRFGEYGIIGFYALKNMELVHFVFSCRILGLGIENYIYNKLERPVIEVQGDVAVPLQDESIDWISEKSFSSNEKIGIVKNEILMIGGCDLEQAEFYLSSKMNVHKEFSTVINGNEIRTSDSTQLINSFSLSDEEKNILCENIPFYDSEITFSTEMFSGKYNVIIWSVVDDYIRGVFRNKDSEYNITFSSFFGNEVQESVERYGVDECKWFLEHFIFDGSETPEFFKNNLETIIERIDDDVNIILINGIDLDVSEWIGKERCERNLIMNKVVDNVVGKYENVTLLDMRKLVKNRNDLPKCDNRHFSRQVYYKMAFSLMDIINQKLNTKDKPLSKPEIFLKRTQYKVLRILKGIKRRILNAK